MKKFISLFLVISMIMCNLNTGVVEALSTYVNEIKLLTDNDEENITSVVDDKASEKEVEQVYANNDEENIEIVDSKNKETVQETSNKNVADTKIIDLKNSGKKVDVVSEKKSSTYDNQGNIQQNGFLVYYITTDTFYYINGDEKQELYTINKNITKNKINLNNMLKNNKLVKSNDILDSDEITLVITGTGSDISFHFDNNDDYYYDVPFNIVFYDMKGEHCDFSFENVKSIHVKGENTIKNSPEDYTALTYSFNGEDPNPLKIYDSSSFIVYNKDKQNIDNNIFYSGDNSGESGDNSDETEDISKNSGDSSIINISFKNNVSEEKNFILESINNSTTPKKISTKNGYDVLSMLLVSDKNSYVLKEEGNSDIPYYYKVSSSTDENNENNEILGQIRTKITLDKNVSQDCYEVDNNREVEVIVTDNGRSKYYLVDTLEKAMKNYENINGYNFEFVFLGDYKISPKDIQAIKNYDKDTNSVTFKTKVDDWKYLLRIDDDIELSANSDKQFSVTFDNIKFKYEASGKCIYANGRQIIFGSDVEMVEGYYPSVLLGGKNNTEVLNSNSKNNSSLIIKSGIYDFIVGDFCNTLQNVDITIDRGTFRNKVIGVTNILNNEYKMNNVQLTIKGGSFSDKVIAADHAKANNVKLTINNGTFSKNQVIGINEGSADSVKLVIDNGTFRNQVIGANGSTVKSTVLTINNGTFYNDIIGALSNIIKENFTLKGLLNRYLLSNDMKITNNQVKIDSLEDTGVNVNIEILGGRFNNLDLIGSLGNLKVNSIVNILGNVTIPTISGFTKLVVGKNKKVNLKVENLDKGSSEGDLYLNKASKLYITSTDNSKLNNIVLDGNGNTLVLPKDITSNTDKEKALIDLSGDIDASKNKKLKIEFTKSNNSITGGMYLIKFKNKSKISIEDKYDISKGYYIRDISDEENSLAYLVLYPQTTFDLEYNLDDNRLYTIDKSSSKREEAWWYNKGNSANITLESSELYKYKGYDLFYDPKNDADRKLILTGSSSDKNITVNNNLNNVNVELNNINLTNSQITLNNLKYLTIEGVNIINNIESINENQYVFTYNFNGNETSNNVLFGNGASYLSIFSKKNINPFNGSKGERIDFKFHKPFREDIKEVRLKNNIETYKFNIPDNTERLGLLLKDNGYYNLYYGEGDTGNSVYVAGNTDNTFTDKFKTSSNSVEAYEDVRRANPVSTVNLEMPSDVNFGVNVRTDNIDRITKDNWENYFYATEMKFKNNSTVVQDEFIDEKGEVHHFGKADNDSNVNSDVNLEYRGIYCSDDSRNEIKLVSKDNLDSDITPNSTYGVKLALKLDGIPIDDSKVIDKPLNNWVISNNEEKTISIEPDFGNNNKFFKISKYLSNEFTLNSSHRFIFRYELRKS